MQLIYAVGMYDRFEYVYVGNLNRRWKESLFTANWGCCGQVRESRKNTTRGTRYALGGLRPSACESSLYLCIVTIEPAATPFGPVGAHKHTHDEHPPLISTNVHIADGDASITFSKICRCVSSREYLPRINACRKKGRNLIS